LLAINGYSVGHFSPQTEKFGLLLRAICLAKKNDRIAASKIACSASVRNPAVILVSLAPNLDNASAQVGSAGRRFKFVEGQSCEKLA
jgi:hypothetical protein